MPHQIGGQIKYYTSMESFISLFPNLTIIVSRYFQRLVNELAECRGDETGSFSSFIKLVPHQQKY
jgi:hypothetical protein